jgi:urease accessory protein
MADTDIRIRIRSFGAPPERKHMSSPLLRLLHLASPALPIGSFHFSQGLEYAVSREWVHDESSALEWTEGLAANVLGQLDLPILARLHAACEAMDYSSLRSWNARLVASRETAELRAEDLHMGSALAKVIAEHELDFGTAQIERPTYAAVFAFACHCWKVGRGDVLSAYAWAWAENQVLAALKLVPLGQKSGQRILHRLAIGLPGVVARALSIPDEGIGVGALMHSVASALHETQYTRLFRS